MRFRWFEILCYHLSQLVSKNVTQLYRFIFVDFFYDCICIRIALDQGDNRLYDDAQTQRVAHIGWTLQVLSDHLPGQLVLVLDAMGKVDFESAVAFVFDDTFQLLNFLHSIVVGDARSELCLQGQLKQVRFEHLKGQVLQLSFHFHNAHLLK